MNEHVRRPTVPTPWIQVALLTFLFGFAVPGFLARAIITNHPPVPLQIVVDGGGILFTGDDVMAGQRIFRKLGLMEFGSIFGHGAYLGPDFAAQYLHHAAQDLTSFYLAAGLDGHTLIHGRTGAGI